MTTYMDPRLVPLPPVVLLFKPNPKQSLVKKFNCLITSPFRFDIIYYICVCCQQQILDLLNDLRQKFSLAMLFISHDLAVVSHVADRVAVMYAGSLVELGDKREIFTAPAHPYTRGLLHAVPTLRTSRDQPLETIEGTVPAFDAMPRGCAFEPRCQWRQIECRAEMPPLVEVAPRHWARCPVVNTPPLPVVGRWPSDPPIR